MSAGAVARIVLGACFRFVLPAEAGARVDDLGFGLEFDRLWPIVEERGVSAVLESFEALMPGSLVPGESAEEQRALLRQTLLELESWPLEERRTLELRVELLSLVREPEKQQALAREIVRDVMGRLLSQRSFRELVTECLTRRSEAFAAAVGVEFAGRYRVVCELGRGGMGVVYQVADAMLRGREFALKIALSDDLSLRRRFEQEAEIGCDLLGESGFLGASHYGEAELDGRSRPFFVMRLVEGSRTLNLHEGSREERLKMLLESARRVARLHELGIIHRDIKPQNFVIEKSGKILLADFGLARRSGARVLTSERVTISGQGMGTPLYMAPEQEDMKRVDERADVYSLGVMLLEAWEGKRPRFGDKQKVFREAPASFEGNGAWLDFLRRCLEAEERRVATCREFVEAVEELLKDFHRIEVPPTRPILDWSLLRDKSRWRGARIEFQDLLIEAIGKNLGREFLWKWTRDYTCGGERFRVARFEYQGPRGLKVALNLIPGGRYTMGSESEDFHGRLVHEVQVPPLLVGVTAVTQGQWDVLGGKDERGWRGPNRPLEGLSWGSAKRWIDEAGGGLRLPSEAEWEYACRAGTSTALVLWRSKGRLGGLWLV